MALRMGSEAIPLKTKVPLSYLHIKNRAKIITIPLIFSKKYPQIARKVSSVVKNKLLVPLLTWLIRDEIAETS